MIFNLSADVTSKVTELMELTESISNKLNQFNTDVDTRLTAISSKIDSRATNIDTQLVTLNSKSSTIDTLIRALNTKTVKSIQRGVTSGSSNRTTVTIKTVDPDKCLVLVDVAQVTGVNHNYIPVMASLSATQLVITESYMTGSTNIPTAFSWQVIEFY